MEQVHKKGTDLARVLKYYKIIDNTNQLVFKIICPFHDDINASMKVNLYKGECYCFGCGIVYDALQFVLHVEQGSDLENCIKYNKILNSKECSDIIINQSKSKKQTLKEKADDLEKSLNYYMTLNKVNWNCVRNKEEENILKYLTLERGLTIQTLKESYCKINQNTSYPVIFPITDNGKFKGYICRAMSEEIESKRKYLYNKGFERATTLAGTYGQNDTLIIVEGFFDMLKVKQYLPNENVCAILGWKISKEQIEKIKRKNITKIISALDNDVCGKKGTKELEKYFSVKRFKYLVGVKDIGETNKKDFLKMYKKTIA